MKLEEMNVDERRDLEEDVEKNIETVNKATESIEWLVNFAKQHPSYGLLYRNIRSTGGGFWHPLTSNTPALQIVSKIPEKRLQLTYCHVTIDMNWVTFDHDSVGYPSRRFTILELQPVFKEMLFKNLPSAIRGATNIYACRDGIKIRDNTSEFFILWNEVMKIYDEIGERNQTRSF